LDLSSNQSFRVVNVHFDHSSKINRHGSAKLVSARISPWLVASEPVAVVGDFNALSWFKTIDILEQAGLELADRDGSTFHFNKGINLFPAIDHVLFSGFEQKGETLTLNKKYGGVWPSDHHPIRVELSLKSAGIQTAQTGGTETNCSSRDAESYC
jgi:endonuclease/exonuclease/phosphatase family metal-dependent hydrolase